MVRHVTLAGAAVLAVLASLAVAEELRWQRIQIDDVFRSEGVAAGDINKDGRMDIIHGEAWYESPKWTMHPIRKLGDYKDGASNYSESFGNWTYDVNGDGWIDLVCVGFPGLACHWYENPQNAPGEWKKHEIWHSACNETPLFLDVTGDGKPELILGSNPESVVGYIEIPSGDKVYEKWNFVAVSDKTRNGTDRFYHGLGVGDVNADGRSDVLIRHGWWEQPAKDKLGKGPWEFHAWTLPAPEGMPREDLSCADIYVDDLDLDGDQDLIMSSAHRVGIWWFENTGTNREPQYKNHLISDMVTQTHALEYIDMNGDGIKDLVTGKRFWAHGPMGDVRPGDDAVVVWFEVKKTKGAEPTFTPHVIGESSGTGIGIQFKVLDFNGDGRLDILLSNKRGTNLLLQRGPELAGR